MAGPRELPELEAFLGGIPFFAALDEASRLELAGQLEPVHVAAGEVVFRQGDAGDGERMLHDLGRAAVVGEIALLTDRPRTATVHAVRDSDLLLLEAPVFQALAERSPALMSGMMRLLADRLLTRDRLITEGGTQAAPPVAIVVAGRGRGRAGSGAGRGSARAR